MLFLVGGGGGQEVLMVTAGYSGNGKQQEGMCKDMLQATTTTIVFNTLIKSTLHIGGGGTKTQTRRSPPLH